MPEMNVNVFKKNFDGASRPNRFAVTGKIGEEGLVNNVLVRAASMPAVTVGMIRVPFRGRIVKVPGDRTYEEWTFTMYDAFGSGGDSSGGQNLEHRDRFLKWHASLNDHEANIPKGSWANGGSIDLTDENTFTQWTVHQLDLQGDVKRSVELHNCWPTVVGELVLNYDSSDAISEFSVTLAYDQINDEPDSSMPIQ